MTLYACEKKLLEYPIQACKKYKRLVQKFVFKKKGGVGVDSVRDRSFYYKTEVNWLDQPIQV